MTNSLGQRLVSLAEAADRIGNRGDVLLPLPPAQPVGLLEELGRRSGYADLTLWCALLQKPFPLLDLPGVRVKSQFYGAVERAMQAAGRPVENLPGDFHGLALMARKIRPRVVASVVSAPDDEGFLSFGLHAGASEAEFYAAAQDPDRLAIAEINREMPYTRGLSGHGEHRIHSSEVDLIVEHDAPLPTLPLVEPSAEERGIAQWVSELIPDGATLQFGIGGVPNAMAELLAAGPCGDFGIHTEMLVDGIRLLHEAGKVTNRKGVYDGYTVCTFALGSRALYDWAAAEPAVRFLPVTATNLPTIIGRNRRFASINAALMIDLNGQVVADSIGGRPYSGVGGHESFVTGGREAEGGKSILCLPSTYVSGGERRSRIVACLPQGSIVTTPRHQVHWVATEHGAVELFGLTATERAERLISIAAPEFRDELRSAHS
jgi:acyl-CoA hydrolase